jgi:hypothetical protein
MIDSTGPDDENDTPSDPDDENDNPSDVAAVDKDLPQIVTDAYHRWEERTNIDPDAPSTDAEREQMEQGLKDIMPSPEKYPESNDGESLPDKEPAPDSDSPSEGGSENEHEGDDRSDGEGGGENDGGGDRDRDGGG